MKKLLFSTLMLAAMLPQLLYAQSNPPFQNPSLDSNCYFPQIGVPGEIDTIYGDSANEGLGAFIHNLGPQQGGMPGNMLIANYAPDKIGVGTTFVYNPSQAPTGSNFNLHDLKAKAQNLLLDPTDLRFGHFRDQTHLDIFDENSWVIYWADDNGYYDSTRYTNLRVNVLGDDPFGGYERYEITSYLTYLTSDTVEDIVVGFYTTWLDDTKDTVFVALFQGGEKLASQPIAYEDTSAIVTPLIPSTGPAWETRISSQGDFRGVRRDDLITHDNFGNLWYYKNDPPFNIGSLAQALTQDTFLVKWQNPSWVQHPFYDPFEAGYFSMPAMPKKQGDRSVDFMPVFATKDNRDSGIFIFKGGPDFGSHRLFLDSADYVIRRPQLGESSWPDLLSDAGDMTGTGNHVLYVAADDGVVAYQNYYVTGQALDDKVDIYNTASAGALEDTLTANNDSFEDILMGLPGYTSTTDFSNGLRNVGSMWLMYGSKNIPVHLNPQFADVKSLTEADDAGITFAPNPITQSWSVATIVWPESENGEYSIYDMLGRKVQEGPIRLFGGAEQQRIYFSGMPQGVYIYTIEGAHGSASARFVKLGGASGASGSSQPSIIQQMKQTRDGKTNPAARPCRTREGF